VGEAEVIVVVVLAGAVVATLLPIVNQSLIYIQAELNSNWPIIEFAQRQNDNNKNKQRQKNKQKNKKILNQLRLINFKHKYPKISLNLQK
jgi:hypothetical protein